MITMTVKATWWWCPCAIIVLWFIQPWFLYGALLSLVSNRRHARAVSAATAVVLAVLSGAIASAWHGAVAAAPPRFVLALLWLPLGTQILRHVHAAAVGPAAFVHHFGLCSSSSSSSGSGSSLDWTRVCIFMWSPATVFFHPHDDKTADPIKCRAANLPWHDVLYISLLDIGFMALLCVAVLYLRLYDTTTRVQYAVALLLRILIMGTSVAFFRIFLEVPVRYALRNHAAVRRILPVYDRPLAATCPRDFWHRWSTSVGYHLRGAFYYTAAAAERNNNMLLRQLVRASLPFGVNGILHIYWWSVSIKGQVEYAYVYLLGVYPLASFLVQDVIMSKASASSRGSSNSNHSPTWWQAVSLRAILWIGFASVAETMQVANGASLSLRDTCRSNLLLPKIQNDDGS